jgi:hypothetical protein
MNKKKHEQFDEASLRFRTASRDGSISPRRRQLRPMQGGEGGGSEAQVRRGAFGAEGGGEPTKAGKRGFLGSVQWTPLLG